MKTQRLRLKSLLTIKNGKDHSALEPGIYPVLGSGGVMRYVNKYLYSGESVLLPRKGTLNNIQYINDSFWTVDTCYYTEIKKNIVLPYYLYAALRSLDLSSLDSGASIPSMTSKTYYGIKLDIPSLPVQKQIASILYAYDILIENNNKQIKILEKMAENLYKEWFVRFRFPGYEQTDFENGIPKGWQMCRMREFCYVTDGTHDTPTPVDVGVPLITGKCIFSGTIDFSLAYNISHTAHEKIKKRSGLTSGDILFSNIGTVGNCCIVDYDREFSVKNVIIFKPEKRSHTEYLYYWMTNASMQEIFAAQTNGASQQFVGLTFMRKFKILVPTEEILTAFADKISIYTEQKRNLLKCNSNLRKQRNLLLPRLMSGKIKV
ncbi:MAG: restriction endonuclease subunit S [Bacteroidales bacterium]|nr:restriction endonuclease subunit S [Bacteroidales bacterium]